MNEEVTSTEFCIICGFCSTGETESNIKVTGYKPRTTMRSMLDPLTPSINNALLLVKCIMNINFHKYSET